ncbi:DUF6975 family protein [Sphingoaurantiacus capsulatus]|uniref:DUF6975 family protein n=1 Tax=Sphingoaurantiacus capsulatus TaxID=1771310 RepID=A0ABV7XBZ4_9SPHN
MAALAFRLDADADDPHAFAGELIATAAAATRSHAHAVSVALASSDDPSRVEALHFFALLHAERPSVAAMAASVDPDRWLASFAERFEAERAWIGRSTITVAAPRRTDLSRHEHLVRGQREAMLTLARSDRAGCALGAVAALAADWPALRSALAGEVPEHADIEIATAIAAVAHSPASRRAIGFGAAQMTAIHRTLWDLLEARQAASLP